MPALALTAAQEGIWFSQSYLGDSAPYGAAERVDLDGPIAVGAWEAAARHVLAETPVLCAAVVDRAGVPNLVPDAAAPPTVLLVDLRGEADPAVAADAWCRSWLPEPIDLARGPVGAVALLRLGDERHVWFQRIHHLALDGYGFALLTRRICQVYDALVAGTPIPAAAVPTLADTLAADLAYRGSADAEADRAHWHAVMAPSAADGVPGLVDAPPAPGGAVHRRRATLDRATVQALAAHAPSASWVAPVLTAAALLVHGLTGATDVVLGLPMLARVGLDALRTPTTAQNLVALPVRVDPAATVRDLFAQVERQTDAARAHQRYRHERLRRELGLLAGDGRFVSLTVNIKPFMQPVRLRAARPGEAGAVGTVTALWEGPVEDVSVSVEPAPDGALTLVLETAATLFSAAETARVLARLEQVVRTLAAADDVASVASISLLLPAEVGAGEGRLCGPAVVGATGTLVDALTATLARDPHAVLLADPDGDSRGDLDAAAVDLRTTWVARRLIAAGAGPEDVVAVALPRGPQFVVALLGVLRAGAAFLPLDPELPPERLADMLARSGAVAVVTDRPGQRVYEGLPTVLLDDAATPRAGRPQRPDEPLRPDELRALLDPRHPAYVIFTSGSTGRPKAVVVEHRSAVNLLATHREHLFAPAQLAASALPGALTPRNADAAGQRGRLRVSHNHSFSFDSGIVPLLALIDGHELHVAPSDVLRDPALLARFVADRAIDYLDVTPAVFEQMVAEGALAPGRHHPVHVSLGGEAAPPALWDALRAHPTTRGWNTYGPTECTVDAVVCPVTVAATPVIGRPIGCSRAYVLDDALRPVPPGVTGELYVAGANLARGYLGQGAATATRFVADPFAGGSGSGAGGTVATAGQRMYRTGDRVRVDADGWVEFLGRTDDQVKLRGYRIEPGEVQHALVQRADVAQAFVVIREDHPGRRALVGYVVPADAAVPPRTVDVLADLATRLPSYLVPSALVVLDALPLTASRKVDRAALPAPDLAAEITADDAPRSAVETVVAELVADILGLPAVGLHDDFFALGGHSLLAARLAARLRTVLDVDLGVREVFDTPTAAGLAGRLARSEPASARPRVTVGPRPDPLPLSPAQGRLWFLARQAADAAARAGAGGAGSDAAQAGAGATYAVPVVLDLRAELDADVLALAVAEVVARHETLRTVYPELDGAPVQRVLAPDDAGVLAGCAVHRVAAPPLAPVPGEAWLEGVTDALARRSFDLDGDVPFAVALVDTPWRTGRAAPSPQRLVLVLHHIAVDGWSLAPLLRDLADAYARRADGRAPDPRPPGIAYADHAVWQHTSAEHEAAVARSLAHWRGQLAGLPPEIALPCLPADGGSAAPDAQDGADVRSRWDADLHRDLAALARRSGATVFMALHAVLAAVLTRSGAGTDVPIGTIVSGRDDPALDDTVGFFTNTVVLRVDTGGNPTAADLLDRVRRADLDALAHDHVPFDRVVEELRPPRAPGRSPLFRALLVLQNTTDAALAGTPLDGELAVRATGTAKFDLTLEVTELVGPHGEPAGLDVRLEHRLTAVDARTAAGLLRWCEAFARAIVADAGTRLWAPVLAGPGDVVPVPASGPVPAVAGGAGQTLTSRWADAAARYPDRVALTADDAHLTYADLDARAAALATELLATSAADAGSAVGPGDLVAIALPPGVDLVVALLAVVRTGAGYLPLDPAAPADRLAFTIADAAPVLVVTDAGSAASQGLAAAGVPVVRIGGTAAGTSTSSPTPEVTAPPRGTPDPDDVGYVIYTSGSTGRPKGVVVTHRAATRLFDVTRDELAIGPDDTWTLFHSISFDFSVWELWGALLHGGRLVVVPHAVTRSPHELLELLARERVTVLNQTPSAFYQLALADREATESSGAVRDLALRLVVFGGEALELGRLADWYARRGTTPTLVNMYGITETTVHVTVHPLTPAMLAGGATSPVGAPIPDLRVHVLDDGLHPVPVGVTGELYVAGPGLARGYLGRAALTAGRFVADPFAVGPDARGARMYRSGDLARVLADGTLDHLGRADSQVKVRGFRIELGEIERVLLDAPGVADAAVVVREDRPGDQRLVAYVVGTAAGDAPDPAAVRAHAAGPLLSHMVPSAVVVLDAFPTTINGKLDRAALPAPTVTTTEDSGPVTLLEQQLCEAFARVLGLPRVGVDDGFFDLGGHSLLAVRLLAEVRALTGTDPGIGVLFEAATPADLARALAEGRTSSSLDVLLPLRGGTGPALFCVHPAGGLSWCYAGLPRHLGDVPVVGVQARGIGSAEPLPASLGEMADDYVEQIRAHQPDGPYHLAGWSLGGMVVQAMAARLRATGHEVGVVALLDAYPSEGLRRVAAPDEAEALGALLAMGGYDESILAGVPLDVPGVVAALRAEGSAMASLAPETLLAIKGTYTNTATILREFEHEVYDGDLLFFRATVGVVDGDQGAQDWAPFVGGQVTVHDVACTHREMAQPEPLAEIGRHLRAALEADAASRR